MDTGRQNEARQQPEVTVQQVTLALVDHPGVAEVSVVPCHHPDKGSELVAFVVRRPAADPPEAELLAHVDHRLSGAGLLRRVVFLDSLPRSATGKVDRRRLEAGEFAP
ncbi:MAG: hypothetical protein H7A45_08500 [Verrucomicrobiales bacterium]|nr:hypothetical protein [Verrucomicrobiales bacterium]